VPFLPTRIGLGTDLFRVNPGLKTIRSPYPSRDGVADEELTAVPALHLDAALCHQNVGDERGNAAFLGPDIYFDDLMIDAADQAFVSVERLVPTEDLVKEAGDVTRLRISRLFVDGVVVAPNGAHPTSCEPDYDRDEAFQREYALTAREPDSWEAFRSEWLALPDEATYQQKVAAR
jgi:glutaconate CoA-transferase subunit A